MISYSQISLSSAAFCSAAEFDLLLGNGICCLLWVFFHCYSIFSWTVFCASVGPLPDLLWTSSRNKTPMILDVMYCFWGFWSLRLGTTLELMLRCQIGDAIVIFCLKCNAAFIFFFVCVCIKYFLCSVVNEMQFLMSDWHKKINKKWNVLVEHWNKGTCNRQA